MNFQELKNKMIFRKDNEYGTFYTLGMSRKDKDDNYEKGYVDVRFKNGVDIPNQTRMDIKESWFTFYIKEENGYKVTKPYIFINDFEIIEQNKGLDSANDINVDDLPF